MALTTCSNCIYWKRGRRGGYNSKAPLESFQWDESEWPAKSGLKVLGLCRRRPPMNSTPDSDAFPSTHQSDGCGEGQSS